MKVRVVMLIKKYLNYTHSARNVNIGKHLSDYFLIKIILNKDMLLLPLLSNFAVEYAIRKVRETQVGLKLSGPHQPLAYADGVNLLRDNIETIKKKIETLTGASKEVDIQINVDKSTCMLLSHHGKNRDIKRTTDP
jgi:hypothetical protein